MPEDKVDLKGEIKTLPEMQVKSRIEPLGYERVKNLTQVEIDEQAARANVARMGKNVIKR